MQKGSNKVDSYLLVDATKHKDYIKGCVNIGNVCKITYFQKIY